MKAGDGVGWSSALKLGVVFLPLVAAQTGTLLYWIGGINTQVSQNTKTIGVGILPTTEKRLAVLETTVNIEIRAMRTAMQEMKDEIRSLRVAVQQASK